MSGLADWETEGARARPATADDLVQVPLPLALRAVTWLGVVLLVAAVGVFSATALVGTAPDADDLPLRDLVLVVIGVGLAGTGVVALLLRLVAGALVRR